MSLVILIIILQKNIYKIYTVNSMRVFCQKCEDLKKIRAKSGKRAAI